MRTVTITWGCHPEFRVTFSVWDSGGPSGDVTEPEIILRVSRLNAAGRAVRVPFSPADFARVMGREACEDMHDAACERLEDCGTDPEPEPTMATTGGRT